MSNTPCYSLALVISRHLSSGTPANSAMHITLKKYLVLIKKTSFKKTYRVLLLSCPCIKLLYQITSLYPPETPWLLSCLNTGHSSNTNVTSCFSVTGHRLLLLTEATNTQSEYVTLIVFPLQQWLYENTLILLYKYIICPAKLGAKLFNC